jgi:hypothetical protein
VYTDGDTEQDQEGSAGTTEDYTFTPQSPDAPNSAGRLTALVNEVLTSDSTQLPGRDGLLGAWIWPERDQVVVQANTVTSELRLALAQRYGTTAVAIWLRPNAVPAEDAESRDNDNDQWVNGGSKYLPSAGGYCTTGFAWGTISQNYIVSAGHCLPRSDSLVSSSIGLLLKSTFVTGKGTVPLSGQTGYYGDLALIGVLGNPPRNHTASIFVGPANSTQKRPVAGRWSRRAVNADNYCAGGATTGQTCNWKVVRTDFTQSIWNKTLKVWELKKKVHQGGKNSGECVKKGDSGGPIYTIFKTAAGNGYVTAKGITASTDISTPTGSLLRPCSATFTDIQDVAKAFGGDIKKRQVQ